MKKEKEVEFSPAMKRLSNLIQNRLLDLSDGEIPALRLCFWADNIVSSIWHAFPEVRPTESEASK